jgi:UDP-GlcNAc:undecaprenyl-phosphate/decaprenyl-phosphate GlcNAc-1-phosphate transferase
VIGAAIAAVGGFTLVVLIVPMIRMLCARLGLYDWPGPLKIHAEPIPRLGGIAVALAILGGSLLSIHFSATGELPFLAAIVLICTIGAIDDIYGLSATIRLAAQAGAGVILWYGGGRLELLGNGAMGLLVSCLLVVAMVNAFNFLDGADGIAGGVGGIIAVTYAALSWPAHDWIARTVACALAGSCAGFLFFNFPPAKIFLGDAGSTVVGLTVAFLSLNFYRLPSSTGARVLFPVVVAALPLLDAALAIIRRVRARVSPCYGDRRHFYDLARTRGASPRVVALVCYGITALLGAIGFFGERARPAEFATFAGLSIGAVLVTALRLGALRLSGVATRGVGQTLAEMKQSRELF